MIHPIWFSMFVISNPFLCLWQNYVKHVLSLWIWVYFIWQQVLQQLQISWAKIKLFCDSLTRTTTRWWSGKIIIGNVWQQPKQEYSLWCEIMFNTFWLFYWMIKTDPSSSIGFKQTLLHYLCKTCPFFMNLRYRLELFCKLLSPFSLFAFPFKNY